MIIIINTTKFSQEEHRAFDEWFGTDDLVKSTLRILNYSDREMKCTSGDGGFIFAFTEAIKPDWFITQISEATGVDFHYRKVAHPIAYPLTKSPEVYLDEYIKTLEDKLNGISLSQFK